MTTASVLISVTAVNTVYNGDIRYFLADLGPTYPCHPLYERDMTWIDSNTAGASIKYVLEGLSEAGFNGVRLPMWAESDQVNGPDPFNPAVDIDHEYCTDLTKNII